jgi:hypothetical protein
VTQADVAATRPSCAPTCSRTPRLCVLQTYAARWTLEVTFHDSKQHLGFGQAQNQAKAAVQRTAPLAGLVYSFVLLWAAAHLQQGGTSPSAGSCARGTAPSWQSPSLTCSQHSARNSGGLAFLRHRCPRGAPTIPLQFHFPLTSK